jgi:hypothetical protein
MRMALRATAPRLQMSAISALWRSISFLSKLHPANGFTNLPLAKVLDLLTGSPLEVFETLASSFTTGSTVPFFPR